MKEERFSKMFADFGTLTDCTLKFTKDGRFRKFGFVGFKTEEDAKKAMKHFNKSFVDTSRVTVSDGVCVCVCVYIQWWPKLLEHYFQQLKMVLSQLFLSFDVVCQ